MNIEQTLYVTTTLLRHYGEHPQQDGAIIAGVLELLEGARKQALTKPSKPKRSTERKTKGAPKWKQNKTVNTKTKKDAFDTGKMIACLKAGRSVAWVADEMGVTTQTIRNHMKKEGIVLKSEAKNE